METPETSVETSVETLEELQSSIDGLVEFLEKEKQQSEEQEQQQNEVLQSDLEDEQQFREAVLTVLNEMSTTSNSLYTDFQEFKTEQSEVNYYINEALPAIYWGSVSLIVLVVLIPLFLIVKVFARLFNRFL